MGEVWLKIEQILVLHLPHSFRLGIARRLPELAKSQRACNKGNKKMRRGLLLL